MGKKDKKEAKPKKLSKKEQTQQRRKEKKRKAKLKAKTARGRLGRTKGYAKADLAVGRAAEHGVGDARGAVAAAQREDGVGAAPAASSPAAAEPLYRAPLLGARVRPCPTSHLAHAFEIVFTHRARAFCGIHILKLATDSEEDLHTWTECILGAADRAPQS